MRFLVSVFLLALSLPISSVVGAAAKGEFCCDGNRCTGHEVKCAEGLSCCYQRPVWMEQIGGTCYDAKTESCASCPVYNPNHPETQVCPSDSPTCCGGCINSTLQCCHRFLSYSFFTCPADKTCCGFNSGSGACCDSNQDCINDVCVAKQAPSTTLPPPAPGCVMPGDLKCGNRCYNPTTHVCTNAATEFLCPVAFPNQCGVGCYSPSQYSCENGQLIPVGSGPGVTQPPSTQPPATQPPATQPPATQPPATIAPTAAPGCVMPGDLRCGTRCYNPSTHVCADPGSSFLCSPAFPSKCGDACYSPAQYKCENGQLKPL